MGYLLRSAFGGNSFGLAKCLHNIKHYFHMVTYCSKKNYKYMFPCPFFFFFKCVINRTTALIDLCRCLEYFAFQSESHCMFIWLGCTVALVPVSHGKFMNLWCYDYRNQAEICKRDRWEDGQKSLHTKIIGGCIAELRRKKIASCWIFLINWIIFLSIWHSKLG